MIGNISLGVVPTTSGNRYHGGSAQGEGSHPYIKGYFYVFFGLPSNLIFDGTNTMSSSDAANIMMTSAEGFTPPGDRTIMTGDIQGQGGVDASFITGQQITREFSIQYKDYWGAPIFRIHRNWTGYINPYLGGSTVASEFSSKEYKGACMVVQTKPVAKLKEQNTASGPYKKSDIIKVDFFDGVMPITDLKSAYDANITDNTFVKPSVQYKFDGFPLDETDENTMTKALTLLNSSSIFESTISAYSKLNISEGVSGSKK